MGTDITLYIEQKIGDRWIAIDIERHQIFIDDPPAYDERNYELFALLAGIRNQHQIKPIAEPRGFPKDLSSALVAITDREEDGHDASWLLLSELLAVDWEDGVEMEGLVDRKNYWLWKRNGKPYEYSGGVSGAQIYFCTNYHMETAWEGFGIHPYTLVRWREDIKQAVGDFYDPFLLQLKALAEGHNDNYRVVFWFDS